ncbi:hypothetical protein jhhlp_000746 [Lomentospora prolificans]|uniref:Fumarylacetoacetase n=1 Tax=Lomentospora prolificans TaxID=41688 RepID=A0A2N3NJF2_9PEZI|nr:hypothetical protein jhhlp_000746 [Lomentospora prolificans]
MTSPDYANHFSRQNIPFGIASSTTHNSLQAVTRLENNVIFLHDLAKAGIFSSVANLPEDIFSNDSLNQFASLPRSVVSSVRKIISETDLDAFPAGSFEDVGQVTMHLPVAVGDFVDFSCSLEHVKNAGRIIINDERPPPAFFNLPIGYQGRASSVVVSGTDIERPIGQYRDRSKDGAIVDGPSKAVDYEMEFAAIIGQPLARNKRVLATDADEHIFGFVVLNDWSARDIQGFEMMPLGPLNGKNFGTTISPWIVTLDALEPFKVPGPARVQPVVNYLNDPENVTYSIGMQVEVQTETSTTVIGKSNVKLMYWTARQMVAHIASAGAALRSGDIMATGTVSGEGKGSHGCMLEATEGGKVPVALDNGSTRTYLQDGDVVRMTAVAGELSSSGVGFGECVGKLLPARPC